MNELLTISDLVARTKLSASFWYQAIADGRLRHFRLGKGQGGIRVSEGQLTAFLEAQERGGASVPNRKIKHASGL